jgi:hypothetical protein
MSSKHVTDGSGSDIRHFYRDLTRDFLLPVGLLLALDILVAIPLVHGERISLVAGVALVIIPKLLLMPWAGSRLLGIIERHYRRYALGGVKVVLLGSLLVSVLAVTLSAVESIQSMIFTRHEQSTVWVAPDPKYRFAFDPGKSTYAIEGEIDFGISRDFRLFLSQHPGGGMLTLDSQGGSIYEGRGLHRIIQEQGLSTRVNGVCSSACVLAFLGGRTRTLAPRANLGFHQYAVDYSHLRHAIPFYDPVREQEHDVRLMRDIGISEAFLLRAFRQPHDGIWYPDRQELIEAGVVHP